MKFLALIPARGGSKRLPRKNVLSLGGKPLIAWTIDLAKQLGSAVDVVVSTDDQEIADVAALCGVPVPWMRPPYLANDTAGSVDVAIHALDQYEADNGPVDGLILLQPTSPFRRLSTVQRGMDVFSHGGGNAVVGVTAVRSHPDWCFTVEDGAMVPFSAGRPMPLRSQDLPPVLVISGVLYIVPPQRLRTERSFVPKGCIPLVSMDEVECVDIDTRWDWLCAEKAVEAGLADQLVAAVDNAH